MREVAGGTQLDVVVAPKSSRDAILGEYQGRLKIALTAPPVDGKANEALIAFLSKKTNVPKSKIAIARGMTSKRKAVQFADLNPTELASRIA